MLDFTSKVVKRIEQADGRMELAVLSCGHEVYGLKPEATTHVCGQCAKWYGVALDTPSPEAPRAG